MGNIYKQQIEKITFMQQRLKNLQNLLTDENELSKKIINLANANSNMASNAYNDSLSQSAISAVPSNIDQDM